MAYLYINSKGQPWRKHSYTAGNVFEGCAYKYYLQKVLGWREVNNKARFEFGKALETAVQHYHENNGQGGIERFQKEWLQHATNDKLQYTRVEKDWATLNRMGTDMMKLYIIRQPSLPIPMGGLVAFQREYAKELFPNDPNYGEIEDAGKLDIVAYNEPNHPMLPKLDWKPEYGAYRPVIIDIKTAGADFPEEYGIAAYDTQLRRYSFLSGIRDVALLTFVKKGLGFKKGYSVTLLEDAGNFKAGQEAVVAQVDDDNDELILVANDFMIEEMEKAQGKKPDGKTEQTKLAKERRDLWLKDNGARVKTSAVTKTRLQFNAGYVTLESAIDAGNIAADQIVRIVNAWQSKNYPNKFGIRYPRDDRSDPYFRAFVLNDEKFRNENFIKSDADELADLFVDADPEEDNG